MARFSSTMFWRTLLFVLILLTFWSRAAPVRAMQDSPWTDLDANGRPTINLYYFGTPTCPYCRAAKPFVDGLEEGHPWLRVHSFDLSADPAHGARYQQLAAATGNQAQYVPAFLFCEQLVVGFDGIETTGAQVVEALETCYTEAVAALPAVSAAPPPAPAAASGEPGAQLRAQPAAPTTQEPGLPPGEAAIMVPLLGSVQTQSLSLPMLTLVLAGMDAFNPCAFFVLLFLLSMVIHARSRARMALIGGVFVFFSGAIYFVFMAAWLNVFLWLGELFWITFAAGLLALGFGALNVKDYFYFRQGPSLSISDQAKPALFERMRGLLRVGSLPALLGSTIVLAIAANSYELLCTAGFPMIFTRVLTLHELSTPVYYAYLLAYSLVYIVPLAAIVALFTVRFSSRKLTENEGRLLKLISGLMMLLMGLVLIFVPAWLSRVEVALALPFIAGLATWIIWRLQRPAGPPARPPARPLRPAARRK